MLVCISLLLPFYNYLIKKTNKKIVEKKIVAEEVVTKRVAEESGAEETLTGEKDASN